MLRRLATAAVLATAISCAPAAFGQGLGDLFRIFEQAVSGGRIGEIERELDNLPAALESRPKLTALYRELWEHWKKGDRRATTPAFRKAFEKHLDITLLRISRADRNELSQILQNLDAVQTEAATTLGFEVSALNPKIHEAKNAAHARTREIDAERAAGQVDRPRRESRDQSVSTSEADIEKAWSCDPIARYGNNPILFRNPDCDPPRMSQEDSDRLRAALVAKYGALWRSRQFQDEQERRATLKEQQQAEIARKREQQEQEKVKEEKEKARSTKLARQNALKAGRAGVSNYEDAILLHSPANLHDVIHGPLLRPDSAIYAGPVVIDAQPERGVIRVKLPLLRDNYYALLHMSAKTVVFAAAREMRIGNAIHVTARYVDNYSYRMTDGSGRTGPVLEGLYIGSIPEDR